MITQPLSLSRLWLEMRNWLPRLLYVLLLWLLLMWLLLHRGLKMKMGKLELSKLTWPQVLPKCGSQMSGDFPCE
jgi:hypothetical protein